MGKREEGMIKLGSQYYDAADVSIDYEWAVVIAFASQAFSLHHRLDLCITGLIALVHRKNGCRGEKSISRGRVCITGATNYYAVVWNFVYNIFICIYFLIASSPLFVENNLFQGATLDCGHTCVMKMWVPHIQLKRYPRFPRTRQTIPKFSR